MGGAVIDVIVVGAGVVGCAVAHELARRGASVEIVDDRPAGMGATQASAGILAPFIEAAAGGPLLDLTARSLASYDQFIARVSADSGLAIPYHRTGTLDVCADVQTLARFTRLAAVLAARGTDARLLDAAQVREAEPALAADIVGGLLIPEHGFVAASGLTQALALAARHAGAQFAEQGRVRRIASHGSDLVVETARGSLAADCVVIAAGCWAGQIDIEGVVDRVPVHPVRGQLLHLAWQGEPLSRVLWSEPCYMVPWDDGTLLVGATVEDAGFDERATAIGVRDLIEAACDLVPEVRSAGFLGARVGLRPGTPDDLPIIGRSLHLPNLMYATGHYRNGILLAPLTAELVADAILDDRIDPALSLTSPARFGSL